VSILPDSPAPFTFAYQAISPVSAPVGTPVDIAVGSTQSYTVSFTPTAPFDATEIGFHIRGRDTDVAARITGVDTVLLAASITPVADVVPTVQTPCNDGIVNIPRKTGQGSFVVKTKNLGSEDTLTVSADTGSTELPLTLSVCKLLAATGQCVAAPSPSVTTRVKAGGKPRFGVFVAQTQPKKIAYNRAVNRIFIRFRDGSEAIRGLTSVAVRSHPDACGP
jgi:hypothetical protein